MCQVWEIVHYVLFAYMLVLLFYALMSWVPSLRAPWNDFVPRLIEPVLQPVRRVIPPMGGLDLSFMVVLLVIQFVNGSIVQHNMYAACTLY